jgi:LacI family transcriptional regulator
LIGFDDLDLGETTNPALSSVSQSGYQLGTTAARILLDRIQGDTGPAKHIVLETSLNLRLSVAAPGKRRMAQRHIALRGRER